MVTFFGAGGVCFVRAVAVPVTATVYPTGSNSWSNSPTRDFGEVRYHITCVLATPQRCYPNGVCVRNAQDFASKDGMRGGLPSQAFSIVGDDSKRDVHKTGGNGLEPAVIKSVVVHEIPQVIPGIDSGRSMSARMLDATNLVEDDEAIMPRNIISQETSTDGVSKQRNYILRYDPRGEPELTIGACSTPEFVSV